MGEVVNPLVEGFYEVKREPRTSLVSAASPLRNLKQVLGEHEIRVGVWVHLVRKGPGNCVKNLLTYHLSVKVCRLRRGQQSSCRRLHQPLTSDGYLLLTAFLFLSSVVLPTRNSRNPRIRIQAPVKDRPEPVVVSTLHQGWPCFLL